MIEPDELLDLAIRSARSVPAEDGPSAEVQSSILRGILAESQGVKTTQPRKAWWNMRLIQRSALAASILLVATVALLWFLAGNTPSAFAQAIQQMQNAKSVQYKITMRSEQSPGKDPTEMSGKILLVQPDWFVGELPGQKVIINQKEQKGVRLFPDKKQAAELTATEVKSMQEELDILRSVFHERRQDEKALGNKVIDGKQNIGFELPWPAHNGTITMWVDAQTQLMTLMVMETKLKVPGAAIPYTQTDTFSDFDWNPRIDEASLTLDPPAGYKLVTIHVWEVELENPITSMARQVALFNNGVFPEQLAPDNILTIVDAYKKTRNVKDSTPVEKALHDNVWRGFSAIAAAESNQVQVHYDSRHYELGASNKPLAWYKRPDSNFWRILKTDLSWSDADEEPEGGQILTVKPSDIPTTASQ